MASVTSILIVEDNSMTAELYQILLERSGYNVFIAMDTERAMQLLTGISVDVILIDYDLPDQTGKDWLATLRHHPGYETLPVVMVSGITRDLSLQDDPHVWFMEKPRHPEHIVTAVESTIQQFQSK
jgi:DNA-binding response OmpR family regulator